jgi:hypothetical protein
MPRKKTAKRLKIKKGEDGKVSAKELLIAFRPDEATLKALKMLEAAPAPLGVINGRSIVIRKAIIEAAQRLEAEKDGPQ